MKKNKSSLLLSGLMILFTLNASSQNVTIDYESWNPSSPPCDVFNTTTAVPAVINGSSGYVVSPPAESTY